MNKAQSVYVVDDDDAVRDSLVALLEPEGFVIRSYSSAADFLKGLDEHRANDTGRACVLLDIHMPGQSGDELLETLARQNRNLAVVVMTGNANAQLRRLVFSRGATGFLEKPADADHLIGAVRAALSASGA